MQKELSIYRQLSNNNTKRQKLAENNIDADQIEFETQVLPAICGSLNAFQNENFCYDLTCRLFKRWLSRQMIKHFFEEITIDLLVAYLFQHDSHVYPSNNSHLSMFIRVIEFIGHFDFVKNVIFVNFNNSLTIERMDSIRQSFNEQRANWPIMTIVTIHDRTPSQHTRLSPDTRIVFHLQKLAKIQLDQLRESLQSFKPVKLRSLFKVNMNIFDIIIKLNTKFLPNKHESFDFPDNIQIKHTLYSANNNEQHSMPIVDYNPAYIYLTMLKKAYENFALFFYDQYGGREIGVLLRPETLETRPFKYSSVDGTKLAGTAHSLSTDNVVINMEALVEDFRIIGNGLVDTVIIKDA
ncbi:nucleolar protein 6-like protein [Euroglyphus maynei]|uniref:Nucleolar protein 6 n=1 Tax=Euroglyphus maynei TaxID=6958 RepID=A0A1Y3ATW4_EURMA|nr:nucleolar protein 6-like protein [Euroglyphus maynei]